jgi:DNA primase
MRFTDTFLRQVRDRVSIADYAGKRLAWDKRKSRFGAGDYWACCPFHQEKSPSFHVLDTKGIFNCFGCGEKGDAFTLAMKLEGISFPEAVAKMAELAGMALPIDEEDRGESDHRKRLVQLAGRAARLYAEALTGPGGANARAYLTGRGLGPDLWPRFGIGYAPGGRTWLMDRLKSEGFKLPEIVAAGLAYEGDGEKAPIDVFRDRIMFEITDPSGKVVAFGGRALDPEQKAKYINSPESGLYSKGRVLYRMKQAREILAKTKASGLVVGEGYLDVIAFERAGIAAVAPCGTALTEDQLQLLWRAGGEPTLCFDGDNAGRRAADRALDLALPHLGPGKTVKIALLPQGEDPDDVFRRAGPDALAPMLAAAMPASDALFAREQQRRRLDTPEARAAFKAGLREAVNRIADPDTKRLYQSDLLARADVLLRPPARGPFVGFGGRTAAPLPASPELRANAARRARPAAENFLRAAVDYPGVLARFGDWVDRLDIADPELRAIRTALQRLASAESALVEGLNPIDREALSLHLSQSGEERAAARLSRWPKARADAAGADLEAEWLALVTSEVILPAIKEELDELRLLADDDDAAFARFQALSREAREIEARAREAKLDETNLDATSDDMVA